MGKVAVSFGRYNYFNKGQFETIRTILEKYDKLVLGVVNPDKEGAEEVEKFKEKYRDFYDTCDLKVLEVPLKYNDKKVIIEKSLRSLGVYNVEVVEVKRVEYFPSIFNKTFPKDRYDLVFPILKTKFDIVRNDAFEEILEREVIKVVPKFESHNSDSKNIRDNIVYYDEEIIQIYKRSGIEI
ncbi:hypothetical protein [Inconstantimicrobium mannanitabidum]|uniref:Uncharacterized protein n=1 Tax=Inconstantimicrobium mannanitabidum TaxID=1604901 RepID=A0ACB5RH28_9CLOT|nr:hypothetical protein [Clostridium sp. TW13]GKX68400.1 hypothetical protein rsdtw13_36580 [Clostridium sp. TW13]